jgi:hypothetical protein
VRLEGYDREARARRPRTPARPLENTLVAAVHAVEHADGDHVAAGLAHERS